MCFFFELNMNLFVEVAMISEDIDFKIFMNAVC